VRSRLAPLLPAQAAAGAQQAADGARQRCEGGARRSDARVGTKGLEDVGGSPKTPSEGGTDLGSSVGRTRAPGRTSRRARARARSARPRSVCYTATCASALGVSRRVHRGRAACPASRQRTARHTCAGRRAPERLRAPPHGAARLQGDP
jgi:hypothetical protein